MSLQPQDSAALLRWRMVLGSEAESADACFGLAGLLADPMLDQDQVMSMTLSEIEDLDETLDFVYGAGRNSGLTTYLPKWLSRVREFFSADVVALVQKDAIEKKGLTRLLFEPETLPYLEKNADLVATLLSARSLVPDEAKEIARGIVKEVVEELRKKLETSTRTALIGAVKRHSRSPFKIARNLDWKRTIARNLHTYDRERKRLVPESFHFMANQRKRHEWDMVLVIDQSGSMATSVVYSAVMAAIFASIDVLRTRIAFFDTRIVDVSEHLSDPVELLFSAQLGGGTDINLALSYAQEHFIERPEKTVFVLITDLYDNYQGDAKILQRAQQLIESKVKLLVLLKLSDAGQPSFDHDLARQLNELGAHCFGASPDQLVEIVERIMKNQPYDHLAKNRNDR